jgi:hypothetical protein
MFGSGEAYMADKKKVTVINVRLKQYNPASPDPTGRIYNAPVVCVLERFKTENTLIHLHWKCIFNSIMACCKDQ